MNGNSFRVKEKLPTYLPYLAVGNLTVQNLYIPTQQTQPVSQPKKGVIYSNNGFLIYKGPDGTITFIASS